jgi:hypothetical protein
MKLLISQNKNENKCLRITAGEAHVIRDRRLAIFTSAPLRQGILLAPYRF